MGNIKIPRGFGVDAKHRMNKGTNTKSSRMCRRKKPFALALLVVVAATLLTLAFLPQPALAETQTIILNNVSNSFPMFSNAEYVNFTIGSNTITLTLDTNASYDGVCNLSNITGTNISAAGSFAELNYSSVTYQTGTYDQKWGSAPYFNDTEHKLYLLSGSGDMASILEMKENVTAGTIPKVVGVGDLVGEFQIATVAHGKNSTYNELDSSMQGTGYADLYVQYAPDTSYENTTFIPTFLDCEKLQLETTSSIEPGTSSTITTAADVVGIASGAEYLNLNNMPLDNVAINEAFDLEYHPVNISCDMFDECWSVKPVQYDDILVILRGTGTITGLNFSFNDSTAAHPEIRFYGYLMGDYNIAANILPHYMAVTAVGPDVVAMNYVEQGGFGVNFGEGPNCACGDICVNTTDWWRDDNITFYPSDTPIQAAIDNATVGDTICVKDGTYNENVDVDKQLTIISETGADSTIVSALDPNDHVFEVTADYVNICGFSVQDATDKTGIYLYDADYCNIFDNNASNNKFGIFLNSSSDCTFTCNTAINNEIGIGLWGSSNNTLTNNTASNNTGDDFYSDESSHDNVVEDLTISSYPTTISFTYDNGVGLKGVKIAPSDPAGKVNISKYVNATNVTADSWIFLNVSYEESDVSNVSEYCLKMYRHNGTVWEEVPGSEANTAENYVWANITSFSIFAPLGGSIATIPTATGSGNTIIETSSGYFCNETAALGAADFPILPDSAVTFHHGFFNLTICGLNTSRGCPPINYQH